MEQANAKILVVDDDSFVRDMLTELLKAYGYEVDTAVNGKDALKKYTANPDFDLIISDMNMDQMNGLELITELRGNGQEIPFVILTVNTEISIALEAIRKGANDYLLKDQNIQETLIVAIDKALEKHRLKIENARLLEDLARKNRELERLSMLDPLTNIANRRYYEKVIDQEWRRALRYKKWLSLIMIDIDYFKLYNDTYGHQQGDICLKKVAMAFYSSLKRSGDFIARYGGEEFCAILPDTGSTDAVNIAEIMRRNIFNLHIVHETSAVADYISVSLGIGSMIPSEHNHYDELLALADEALYQAKTNGRNRIESLIIHKKEETSES